MNSKQRMYHLMMMFAAMGSMMPGNKSHYKEELTESELAEIETVRKEKEIERKRKRGIKEFDIDGIKVYALNKRNAIRKANNINKLL